MYILFVDTHSNQIVLILYKENSIIKKLIIKDIKLHSSYLTPSVVELFSDLDITINDLNEICVINGPGSFTSIRLGVTIAKIIAYSVSIPIKTLTFFQATECSVTKKYDFYALSDPKGYYMFNNMNRSMFYITKSDLANYENVLVDYNNIDYKSLKQLINKEKAQNVHLIKPLYIKKIGVEQ